MKRWHTLVPLGAFVVLLGFLGVGLNLNPREVPSPLIGKPAPDFTLPRLDDANQTMGRQNPVREPGVSRPHALQVRGGSGGDHERAVPALPEGRPDP